MAAIAAATLYLLPPLPSTCHTATTLYVHRATRLLPSTCHTAATLYVLCHPTCHCRCPLRTTVPPLRHAAVVCSQRVLNNDLYHVYGLCALPDATPIDTPGPLHSHIPLGYEHTLFHANFQMFLDPLSSLLIYYQHHKQYYHVLNNYL